MATKKVCDRCGAEINPISSTAYAQLRSYVRELLQEKELCVSCSFELRNWLDSKDGDKDG